jgi:hypothetical protein
MRFVRSLALLSTFLLPPTLASAQAVPATAPAPAAPVAPAAPPDRYMHSHAEALALGRAVVAHAYAGALDSLIAFADPAMGAPDALRARLAPGLKDLDEQLGPELKLITERVMLVNGGVQYWRKAEYVGVPMPLLFRVVLGAKGTWRGFTASPEDAAPAGEEILP